MVSIWEVNMLVRPWIIAALTIDDSYCLLMLKSPKGVVAQSFVRTISFFFLMRGVR